MTNWQFNLRSGYDDDDEEDIEVPMDHSSIRSAEDELRELFGTGEGEESVAYKPNPWNIAKLNASARNAANNFDRVKPRQRNGGRGTNASRSNAIVAGRMDSRGPKKTDATPLMLMGPPHFSLKDSISAVLQRDPVLQSAKTNVTGTINSIPTSSSTHSKLCKNEAKISTQSSKKYTLTKNKKCSSPVSPHQEDGYIPPPDSLEPSHTQNYLGVRAFIPQDDTTIPQNSSIITSVLPDIPELEVYEEQMPKLIWDYSSDDLTSSVENGSSLFDFQQEAEPCHGSRGLTDGHATPLLRPLSPDLMSSMAMTSSHENIRGDNAALACMRVRSLAELEPPLTLQHADGLPRDASAVNIEGYSSDANHVEKSFSFVYASPAVHHISLPNAVRSSTPIQRLGQEFEIEAESEDTIPVTRREPVTPLQPTRKGITASNTWLDPDEEPVWSTLPSRTKKTKQVKTPTTISRFRLPGAFLGSSPLGEQESKRLYKPPPSKRSLEQEGDQEQARWKVTRIG